MLVTNRDLFYGENVIQKGIMFITGIIAAFIGGILGYLFILLMIQLFKLFFCTYKKVNIHLRILDVIINLEKRSCIQARIRYMMVKIEHIRDSSKKMRMR